MLDTIASTKTAPKLRKLTRQIGAEVNDIDLGADLPQETIDWINSALVENKVLIFRDQDITQEQQIALGRRFGELEVHPFTYRRKDFANDVNPEIVAIDFEQRHRGSGKGDDAWHSDVSWRQIPSMGSILRGVIVPEYGGDTMWVNMEACYDSLDNETKARLEGLQAVHDWHVFRDSLIANGATEDEIAGLVRDFPPAVHPVVRTHPVSGRKSIYVNSSFTTHIVGMDKAESDALLARLFELPKTPEFQYRLYWRPGTIAFWDNRSTQHYAVSEYDQRRRVERVTIIGDRPR